VALLLTAPERFEHWGRMLNRYLTQRVNQESDDADMIDTDREVTFAAAMIVATAEWRENSSFETKPKRAEAGRHLLRAVYEATTGRDPVVDDHDFRAHWIEQREAGEGAENAGE